MRNVVGHFGFRACSCMKTCVSKPYVSNVVDHFGFSACSGIKTFVPKLMFVMSSVILDSGYVLV